ncbi:MAG: NAD(P)-binding domain-containing protein [Cloacibacterium normanense]
MKIAILGAGNMGVAFSRSFFKYELVKPQDLQLIIRNEKKVSKIKKEFPEVNISYFARG